MRYSCFTIFLVFCSLFSCAQFNDSTHYHIRYSITGIVNKTNDRNSFVLNNNLAFAVNKKKTTFSLGNSWIYGRLDGNLSNNDFASAFNADFLKNQQRVYYWGLGSFLSSFSLKVNHQVQAGGGIGINVFNKQDLEIVASNGLLYETSSIEKPAGINEKYQTIRNSLRIKHRWVISNRLTLEGTHFWQPSLEKINDYIIRSSGSLQVQLRRWLSLSSMITYNKISNTNRENLLINFGLVAENYF